MGALCSTSESDIEADEVFRMKTPGSYSLPSSGFFTAAPRVAQQDAIKVKQPQQQ